MAEIRLTLTTPTALGVGPSRSALVQTHWHVPGTVLRGALAAAWIRARGRPGEDHEHTARFVRLFERKVFFGPLFAPGACPRPLSIWSHKYRAGTQCARSEWDTVTDELPDSRHCPYCEQPLERAKGEITRPTLHHSAHVALTEDGTARAGALFTRQEISEHQTFIGHITGAWSQELAFDAVWLGGGRSVRGHATLTADPTSHRPPPEVRDRAVVLRLLSPGIFVDQAGRPVQDPDPAELAARLGVGTATVTRRWVRWTQVHGWHTASNLPKPMEHAVAAGSVFVVECDRTPDIVGLQRLADEGVGLRRTEGYGVIGGPPPRRESLDTVLGKWVALRRLAVERPAGARLGVIPAIEEAAADLRDGRPPSTRLARFADVVDGADWQRALRFLATLTDPDQLDAVAADLRKSLRN